MLNSIQFHIDKVAAGEDLSQEEASRAFQIMMSGGATPAQMGALLLGLRVKGETIDEITGGAIAMRARAEKISAPKDAIDTCGTGGDAKGTFNISTAVAIVTAACGVAVAKHGNRSVSSRSGSADILQELGLNLKAETAQLEQALAECNLCFMMAPKFHEAMRHIAPVRQELGVRTIFNLLGPLTNPAGTAYQLIGVYDRKWLEPLAHVLRNLGTKRAWIVHGSDGMDELTLTGKSYVAELNDGEIRSFEISPSDAGLEITAAQKLTGGDCKDNAMALTSLLCKAEGAYRDIVLLNSAAALIVAGKTDDLKSGVMLAAEAIDSNRAKETLASLIHICRDKDDRMIG